LGKITQFIIVKRIVVKVTVNKIDDANITISGEIEKSAIDNIVNKLAKEASKQIKVDGFRPGKVPPHIVKKLHGDKLEQDAEGEALRDLMNEGLKEAGVEVSDMIGEPAFKKYEKGDDKIEVELEVSLKPKFEAKDYKSVIPSFEKSEVEDSEVDARIEELAKQSAPLQKIKRKRMVRDGDTALIDFEGFVDGEAFEGGKAEKYALKIGSGTFIPGFEDQIIGMKYDEEKTITVKFPEEYQAANLAGKDAEFKVKLHEIQEQVVPEINDELAQKITGDKEATLESLKTRIKEQIQNEKLVKVYQEELKPQTIEALVKHFDFALPNNIVEQEIDAKVNQKAREMSKEELEEYKKDPSKVEALREELRDEAKDSVKATFIVDELAKAEGVSVSDEEVSQALYYEALMSGQDPQQIIEYYQKNNLLPAVKMGMMEDRLFGKLLGLDS
jgi:trigger factor